MHKLAEAHLEAGYADAAMPIFENIVDTMGRGLGTTGPAYGVMLGQLGKTALAMGQVERAIEAYQGVLQTHDPDNMSEDAAIGRAEDRLELARILSEHNRPGDALEHLQHVIELYHNVTVKPSPRRYAYAINMKASVLSDLGHHAAAVSELEYAMGVITRADHSTHCRTRFSRTPTLAVPVR